MKYDIITAGVGGQGVLSVAAIVSAAALRAGLRVAQSEVHGMSQRGGAVVAHLRIADHEIHSAMIGLGGAELIISMEPLESLRYLDSLTPSGTLLTSTDPVRNIPDYPEMETLLDSIRKLPSALLIDALRLAREAGAAKAANMVMVGSAADLLPMPAELLKHEIEKAFRSKGEKMVKVNIDAFTAGRRAVHYKELVDVYDPTLETV
jgi:Pyruvate:ferredoxin oxidoreductase and related 2-oxoacid:ferredoxin oxidoreductases, gamma subunit